MLLVQGCTAAEFGSPQRMGQFIVERSPPGVPVFIVDERRFAADIAPAVHADRATFQRALDSFGRQVPDNVLPIQYQEGDYRLIYFCQDQPQIFLFQLRQQPSSAVPEIVKVQCRK